MKTKQAIKLAGSASALAGIFGITRAAVAQWDKHIPPLREYQLREKRPQWFVERPKVAAVEQAQPAQEQA